MGYFDDMIGDDNIVARDFTFNGKTKVTYWKPVTAGEKLSLLKGQSVSFSRTEVPVEESGKTKIDVRMLPVTQVQLDESFERNQRLVWLTLCDEKGKRIYAKLQDLQSEPAKLIEALIALAKQVVDVDEDEEAK